MFTPEMDAFIQDNYCTMPLPELCDALDPDGLHGLIDVEVKDRAMKLRKRTGRPGYIAKRRCTHPKYYTERDRQFAIENVPVLGYAAVADRLGRSEVSLRSLMRNWRIKMGLHKVRSFPSAADVEFIKNNWPRLSYRELAVALGWTRSAVAGKVKRMADRGIVCRKKETTQSDKSKGVGVRRFANSSPAVQRSRSLPQPSMRG